MPNTPSDNEIIKNFMADINGFFNTLPPADVRINHTFAPGVYLRKMFAKKGSIIVSRVHTADSAFIVSKGKVLIFDGVNEPVIIKAPYDGITLSGTKRMGIALEDTVWINVHPTKIKPKDNSTSAIEAAVKKIEKRVVEPFKNLHLNS